MTINNEASFIVFFEGICGGLSAEILSSLESSENITVEDMPWMVAVFARLGDEPPQFVGTGVMVEFGWFLTSARWA